MIDVVPRRLSPGCEQKLQRDGKRFVVHADELLTAFFELEAAIRRM